VMFDTKSLATIKTIEVQGNPDGILFDPTTEQVFVFSHSAPHATVIGATDGSIAGTIALGGAPEQAVSDGMGHVYVAVEDKDRVAVVDAKTLKMTAQYDLGGKGGTPAGLAIDVKNHILFACCRNPQTVVILSSDDGKIITSLPIGSGTDGAVFNPKTMVAFSSQRVGTLTVIKENSPRDFVVEQNVTTMPGAKTLTLDSNTNQIYLIAAELAPPPAEGEARSRGQGARGGRRQMVPDSFTIIVVGR
jgi:DNA-binding beta-propeller fold protein YncE